jgi:hypothetical protein
LAVVLVTVVLGELECALDLELEWEAGAALPSLLPGPPKTTYQVSTASPMTSAVTTTRRRQYVPGGNDPTGCNMSPER